MTINATLQVRLNGGAAASGGVDAAANDIVQITAPDRTGWGAGTRAQIWAYSDPTFACPAGFTDSGDDPTTPTFHVIGRDDPPTFVIPAGIALSLRWLVKDASGGMVEGPLTIVRTPYANGVWPIGAREQYQFGGNKLAVAGPINENFKTFGEYVASAGLAAAGAPPNIGAASSKGVDTAHYSLEDHSHGHGNQLGGTTHAAATTAANGFATTDHVSQLTGEPSTLSSASIPTAMHAPKGTRTILPSVDDVTAAVVAAHTAGFDVELVGGADYTAKTRGSLRSGYRVFSANAQRPARIIAHTDLTWSGGVSSLGGYLWKAETTIGSQFATARSVVSPAGTQQDWTAEPTVGSTYQLRTGDAASISATGVLNLELQIGDYIEELVTVTAKTDLGGGNWRVTFDKPVSQGHYGHPSTTPTTKVYSTSNVCEEIQLENIYFDLASNAAGRSQTVALYCPSVKRVVATDVHISGCSVAGLYASAGTTIEASIWQRGGCNAYVFATSAFGWVEYKFQRGAAYGARCHASGIPIGACVLRYNTSDFRVFGEIRNHVGGVVQWGGLEVNVDGLAVWHNDQTERVARDTSLNPASISPFGKRCGSALSIGDYGSVPGKMRQIDTLVGGVEIYQCSALTAAAALTQPTVFISDGDVCRIPSIGIHNVGAQSNGNQLAAPVNGGVVLGIMVVDGFQVEIGTARFNGVCLAFMFSGNGLSRVYVDDYWDYANDGTSNTAFWFASLDEATALIFHIKRAHVWSITDGRMGYSALGSTPVDAVMMGITIDELEDTSNGRRWDNCVFAKAAYAGTIGTAVELYDDAGVLSIRLPTGTHGATLGVTIRPYGDANNDFAIGQWVLVSKGPFYCVASSENPVRHTVMTLGTAGDVIAHVAGATYTPMGTVVSPKASGLIQLFRSGGQLLASAAKTANTLAMRGTSGELAVSTLGVDDILFPAAETSPSIRHTLPASGAGSNLIIEAQQAFAGVGGKLTARAGKGAVPGTNLAGGIDLDLGAAVANVSSALSVVADSTTLCTISQTAGARFDLSCAALPYLHGASGILIGSNDDTVRVSCDQGSGFVSVVGTNGGVRLQDSFVTYLEVARVAASRRVVGIGVGANLNTTKMPANTGDRVVFWGNCGTAPTADCDSTGIIAWVESQQLRMRANIVQDELSSLYSNTSGTASQAIVHQDRDYSLTTTTTTANQVIGALTLLSLKGVARIRVSYTGFDTTGDAALYADQLYRVQCVSGTLTLMSTDTIGTSSLGGGSVSAAISGTTIQFRVTPGGTNNTRWSAHVEAAANYIG